MGHPGRGGNPPTVVETICRLVEDEKLSYAEIGRRLGMTRHKVKGIATRSRLARQAIVEEICRRLIEDEAISYREIGRRLGLSRHKVVRIAARLPRLKKQTHHRNQWTAHSPALVAAVCSAAARDKYELVAFEFNLTKGQVAGILHRHRARLTPMAEAA